MILLVRNIYLFNQDMKYNIYLRFKCVSERLVIYLRLTLKYIIIPTFSFTWNPKYNIYLTFGRF